MFLPAAALALGAGCTLLNNLDGFASGAGGVDTGLDAATREGGGDGAAGIEGGSDAGTSVGCGRYADASFCVDFEGPDPLGPATWTENNLTSTKGTIALSKSPVVSPVNALRFDLTKSGAGGCDYLVMKRAFPGSFSKLTTRFAMRAEAEGIHFTVNFQPQPNLAFTLIAVVGSGTLLRLFAQSYDNVDVVEVAGQNGQLSRTAVGRWVDVTFEATTATRTATLTVDDVKVGITLPAGFAVTAPKLVVGPYCLDHPAQVSFDDLAAWLAP